VSRELFRNSRPTKTWTGGYEPVRAEALSQRRRRWDNRFKLTKEPALQAHVRAHLQLGWSPEQIAGRLHLQHSHSVISHESIYRFIYHRSAQKDYWHRLLPRHKSRRGRLGLRGGSPVNHIKQRVPIHARLADINARVNPRHWEADLILFARLTAKPSW
jgi:IS30 family transposase